MLKKIIAALVLILAIVIACLCTFFYAKKKYENITVNETVAHDIVVDTVETVSGETIEDGLADIGELATEEYFFTRVETYDSSKNIKGFVVPFTKSRFVYSYDGVIKAGIDFTGIKIEKDDLKKVITVTIPEARILDRSIDPDTFELYDEKNSVFNPFSVTDFNDTLDDMLAAAEADAIEKGVLERAGSNAELLIKNFIQSSYDLDEYYIDVK